ncbi:hypothetical protein H1C71_004132, partial [Ictidomys tridecemlineatus]
GGESERRLGQGATQAPRNTVFSAACLCAVSCLGTLHAGWSWTLQLPPPVLTADPVVFTPQRQLQAIPRFSSEIWSHLDLKVMCGWISQNHYLVGKATCRAGTQMDTDAHRCS